MQLSTNHYGLLFLCLPVHAILAILTTLFATFSGRTTASLFTFSLNFNLYLLLPNIPAINALLCLFGCSLFALALFLLAPSGAIVLLVGFVLFRLCAPCGRLTWSVVGTICSIRISFFVIFSICFAAFDFWKLTYWPTSRQFFPTLIVSFDFSNRYWTTFSNTGLRVHPIYFSGSFPPPHLRFSFEKITFGCHNNFFKIAWWTN